MIYLTITTESTNDIGLQVLIILLQIMPISLGASGIDGNIAIAPSINNSQGLFQFMKVETDGGSSSDELTRNSSDTQKPKFIPKLAETVAEDFGSLHTLERLAYWANKEEEIYNVLKARRTGLKREMELINIYMEDYRKSSGKALENMIVPSNDPQDRGKVIGSSAILSHLMTFRYATKIVRDLRSLLESREREDVRDSVNTVLEINKALDDPTLSYFQRVLIETNQSDGTAKRQKKWPNWQDSYISHTAILIMHEIYAFYPSQFNKGFEIDTISGGSLKVSHCIEIGMFALSRDYYYMAIEWLEFGRMLFESKSDLDSSVSSDFLMSLLNVAIMRHNEFKMRLISNWTDEEYEKYLNSYTTLTFPGQQQSKRIRGRISFFKKYWETYGNQSAAGMTNFLSICSGKRFQPEEVKSRLKCFLERKRHHYFILNPVKVEQLSEYPYIVQMYDVLRNDTIKRFHEDRGDVKLSGITTKKDISEILKFRTSAGQSVEDELRGKINKISELITGLVVNDNEEQLQAVDYVYGRHYNHHSDVYSFKSEKDEIYETVAQYGNRLATVLYYLEEPAIGGLTPFCNVGTYAEVKKGSAVFWINMYRNGSTRHDVGHGSCPVIHGHKMILNQWIRHHSNFQTFKCSLNQFE